VQFHVVEAGECSSGWVMGHSAEVTALELVISETLPLVKDCVVVVRGGDSPRLAAVALGLSRAVAVSDTSCFSRLRIFSPERSVSSRPPLRRRR
jgi:hypothetical protein